MMCGMSLFAVEIVIAKDKLFVIVCVRFIFVCVSMKSHKISKEEENTEKKIEENV